MVVMSMGSEKQCHVSSKAALEESCLSNFPFTIFLFRSLMVVSPYGLLMSRTEVVIGYFSLL